MMNKYLYNESVLGDVEGKFENYYKNFIPTILLSLEKNNIDSLFGDEVSRLCCINKLVKGIVNQISEISILSLIDFYQKTELDYLKFNKSLLDSEFVEYFHNVYPVLPEKIQQTIMNYSERFDEIFSTIFQYKKDIEEFIGKAVSLTDIEIFEGDFHKSTFVVMLTVGDKKIVLKKRTNLGEQCLNIFFKYFQKESIPIPIIRTKILSNTICLQDFILPDQFLSKKEVKDYYYKFGVMTAIFTILGTKDLHSENVIATRNGPYFIDLEAAITAKLSPKSYSLVKESYLFNSNEERVVFGNTDLSAFSGRDIYMNNLDVVNTATDNIELGAVSKKFERQNIPKDMTGKKIDPEQYTFEVFCGYRQGVEVFNKFRKEIISDLEKIENYEYRLVIRNTGFYVKYLSDLCLPVYTQSSQKTKNYLNLLSKSTRTQEIIQEEIDCLQNNMVPYFTTTLFSDSEDIKSDFLNRLRNFDSKTECREEHYLKMILNIQSEQKSNLKQKISTENRIIEELSHFVNLCSNDDIFSYGTIDSSIHSRLMDYKNDIYTFGGSLLFLNSFYNENNLSNKIKNTITISRANKHISGFTGYQAELLLKFLSGITLDNEQYIPINKLMYNDDVIDFSTYGSAILALNILYKNSLFDKYLVDIQILGKKYLNNIHNQELTGLLHGYAGDCLVLNILYKYMDKQLISEIIFQKLIEENKSYLPEERNWIDKRGERNEAKDNLFAISYGTPGILIGRLFLYLNKGLPDYIKNIALKDIKEGVKGILGRKRSDFLDDTLINGYAGSLFVLTVIKNSKVLDSDRNLLEKIEQYISLAKSELTNDQWRCHLINSMMNFSFFNGRLGIVFVLSMISDKEFGLDIVDKIFGV